MPGAKKHQHDSRLMELNNLLRNGEPSINRMKELYNAISAKHLSQVNMPIYTALSNYLNRRLAGMDHTDAYIGSNLRQNDIDNCHKSGTKAAKRSTLTRLKDKVATKEIEEIMKRTLEEAKAEGIHENDMKVILDHMFKAQAYRPEFMRSVEKATNNLKLENGPSGGGAGSDL